MVRATWRHARLTARGEATEAEEVYVFMVRHTTRTTKSTNGTAIFPICGICMSLVFTTLRLLYLAVAWNHTLRTPSSNSRAPSSQIRSDDFFLFLLRVFWVTWLSLAHHAEHHYSKPQHAVRRHLKEEDTIRRQISAISSLEFKPPCRCEFMDLPSMIPTSLSSTPLSALPIKAARA